MQFRRNKGMKINIKKYVKYFMEERLEEIIVRTFTRNKKYITVSKDVRNLQLEILKKLEENHDLMVEYESLVNHQNSILLDYVYKQGFLDAMRLIKLFKSDLKAI
jgi:hypothetical protein